MVKLLLESGAISYRILDCMRNDQTLMDKFGEFAHGNDFATSKENMKLVLEAASTPMSLMHACRLVVSRCITCVPGRRNRVNSLPVPQVIKDLINFKDVCEPYLTED